MITLFTEEFIHSLAIWSSQVDIKAKVSLCRESFRETHANKLQIELITLYLASNKDSKY